VAEGLPEGWVVSVSEHGGQLGLVPYEYLALYEAYVVYDPVLGEGRIRRRLPAYRRRDL